MLRPFVMHRHQAGMLSKKCTYALVTFKKNDSAAFITSRKIVTSVIELNGRNDIGYEGAGERIMVLVLKSINLG